TTRTVSATTSRPATPVAVRAATSRGDGPDALLGRPSAGVPLRRSSTGRSSRRPLTGPSSRRPLTSPLPRPPLIGALPRDGAPTGPAPAARRRPPTARP